MPYHYLQIYYWETTLQCLSTVHIILYEVGLENILYGDILFIASVDRAQ